MMQILFWALDQQKQIIATFRKERSDESFADFVVMWSLL